MNYYMITFDLPNSLSRTNEYSRIKSRLKFKYGPRNYYDFVKQVCFIRTPGSQIGVISSIIQAVGKDINVIVIEVTRENARHFVDKERELQAKNFFLDMEVDELL